MVTDGPSHWSSPAMAARIPPLTGIQRAVPYVAWEATTQEGGTTWARVIRVWCIVCFGVGFVLLRVGLFVWVRSRWGVWCGLVLWGAIGMGIALCGGVMGGSLLSG